MRYAASQPGRTQIQHKTKQTTLSASLILGGLSALLLCTMLAAISIGTTAIPFSVIVRIVLNSSHVFHFAPQWNASTELILWQYRLPIVVSAALVGAALAVAGVLFQGLLRNPLADPYLMGTSSGAALGATIAFLLPLDTVYGTFFPLTPTLAFIGAISTVFLVYTMARSGGRTPVVMLLLAGVVVNAVLVAFQNLLLTLRPSDNVNRLLSLFSWLAGGIGLIGWPSLLIIALIVGSGIVCSFFLAHVLDAFALGEEGAAHLGFHVEWYKFLIIAVASLLTAAAVSISGLIGFVGLVTPHFMRLLLGPNHRLLLPASALGGAIFLTLADLLARVIFAPNIVPVGICTALVGAPFFLFLLRNSKREYKW